VSKTLLTVIGVSLIVFLVTAGCAGSKGQTVTFDDLFGNSGKYNGKSVVIEGFYFSGFEVQVIAESLDYSGYAEGHLAPGGRYVWVGGGIPWEVWSQLYKQKIMGPEERYGKVRLEGKFEYSGKYGHGGGYSSQIIPSKVEPLPWSPPH